MPMKLCRVSYGVLSHRGGSFSSLGLLPKEDANEIFVSGFSPYLVIYYGLARRRIYLGDAWSIYTIFYNIQTKRENNKLIKRYFY